MQSILDSVHQMIQRDQWHVVHPYIHRLLTSNLGSQEYLHSSLELAKIAGVVANGDQPTHRPMWPSVANAPRIHEGKLERCVIGVLNESHPT